VKNKDRAEEGLGGKGRRGITRREKEYEKKMVDWMEEAEETMQWFYGRRRRRIYSLFNDAV
jgi:hypothetical protein